MKIYFIGSLFIASAILILFAYNIFKYNKILSEKKIKSLFLLSLRSFSIFILLILFIDPHIFYNSFINRKKEVNIFIDNSMSIKYQGVETDSIHNLVLEFDKSLSNNNIKTNVFLFDDSIKLYSKDLLNLNGSKTSFLDIQERINNSTGNNIILTDGNSSYGYGLVDLDFNYPINLIGIGSISNQDISISEVQHDDFVIKGDSISVSMEISSMLDTTVNSIITISSNDKVLLTKPLMLSEGENKFYVDEILPSIDIVDGNIDFNIIALNKIEENILNNSYKTKVDLIDQSKKILLLSGSLNPNTQGIKNILSLIPNSELRHIYKINNSWNNILQNSDYPDYELIIYDNFPVSDSDLKMHSTISKNKREDSRFIYFEGPSYNVKTIDAIFKRRGTNFEHFNKIQNSNFLYVKNLFSNLPSTKRNYMFKKNYFDNIHLSYSDQSAAIAVESNRMYVLIPEISSLLLKDELDEFKISLSNIMYRFMDRGSDIKFNVKKRDVLLGESIEIKLDIPEVYDRNEAEIILDDINTTSPPLSVKLNRLREDKLGRIYLENIPEGEYEVYCRVLSETENYLSKRITLAVNSDNYEVNNLFRNINDMNSLALMTKGNYYDIENYKGIIPLLNNYVEKINKKNEINVHTFHNYWFIILLTLIIEWFLRKRKGLL